MYNMLSVVGFWVAVHTHNIIMYGAHAGMEDQFHIPMDQYQYSDTLHTESEVYDINYEHLTMHSVAA